jgi:pilus assembly protein CpaF
MAFDALTAHYWHPIRALLERPDIADIFIDRFDRIYTSGAAGYEDHPGAWSSDAELTAAIAALATAVNASPLNDAHPILDTRLPDGSRVNASVPPISPHAQATIRVARPVRYTLDELCALGMMSVPMRDYLLQIVERRANFVVSGATNSGKTTLLRALLTRAAAAERLYVVEDTAELHLHAPRGVRHELTAGNRAQLSMTDSLHAALRSAPDRLVVGEIRSEKPLQAFLEMLEAGFRGGAATLHATSAEGALLRMESLLQRLGLFGSAEPYVRMVRTNIDVVVHCARVGRYYRVVEIAEIEDYQTVPVARWAGEGWVGAVA